MDVMAIRRGLMAQMACKLRYAEGVFTLASNASTYNLVHNLGSTKILVCAQRVNEDHTNINVTNTRYLANYIFGTTGNAQQIDFTQTYSYNGGNQVHYQETGTASSTYPGQVYGYFPAADGTAPFPSVQTNPSRRLVAVDENTVTLDGFYQMVAGRWVWRAWALD